MGIGADFVKAVAAAKKDGIDVSGLKGVDSYGKTLETMQKMIASLASGEKDVDKYEKNPTKALAKDVIAHFAERKEFAKLWAPISKDHDAYRTVLTNTQKDKSAAKSDPSVLAALVYTNQIEQVFSKSPFLQNADKTIKDVNKAIDDRQKTAKKKFEDEQKELLANYEKVAKKAIADFEKEQEKEAEELYIRV